VEAGQGRAPGRALRRCLPAITASAATVAIATLCLLAGRMNSTRGLGPVAAIGIVVAFLAMTSLLPALLVILGRWLFWPRAGGLTARDMTGVPGRAEECAVADTRRVVDRFPHHLRPRWGITPRPTCTASASWPASAPWRVIRLV
jgi:uncharacterized membrane protein YdfJ with MMPL/SSD domain